MDPVSVIKDELPVIDLEIPKPVVNVYQRKYELLQGEYKTIVLHNERLQNRLCHVRKEILGLKRLKRFLIHRLINAYHDRFMDVSLEIPDTDANTRLEDSIFSSVCEEAERLTRPGSEPGSCMAAGITSAPIVGPMGAENDSASVSPIHPSALNPQQLLPELIRSISPKKKRPSISSAKRPRPVQPVDLVGDAMRLNNAARRSRAKRPQLVAGGASASMVTDGNISSAGSGGGSKPQTPEVELSIEQIVECVATGREQQSPVSMSTFFPSLSNQSAGISSMVSHPALPSPSFLVSSIGTPTGFVSAPPTASSATPVASYSFSRVAPPTAVSQTIGGGDGASPYFALTSGPVSTTSQLIYAPATPVPCSMPPVVSNVDSAAPT